MRYGWLPALLIGVASLSTARAAFAQSDWGLVLNGRAIHVNAAKNWNEDNWGLGFEREFNSDGRWVKVVLANGFRDSVNKPSYMAGGGLKRRFRLMSDEMYVDLGIVGFMMTRADVNHNRPFPGALPAMTFGARHFAVNVTYMPEAVVDHVTKANLQDPQMRGVFFLQLRFDAALFGLAGRRAGQPLAANAK
jgi:hypothetical protein